MFTFMIDIHYVVEGAGQSLPDLFPHILTSNCSLQQSPLHYPLLSEGTIHLCLPFWLSEPAFRVHRHRWSIRVQGLWWSFPVHAGEMLTVAHERLRKMKIARIVGTLQLLRRVVPMLILEYATREERWSLCWRLWTWSLHEQGCPLRNHEDGAADEQTTAPYLRASPP